MFSHTSFQKIYFVWESPSLKFLTISAALFVKGIKRSQSYFSTKALSTAQNINDWTFTDKWTYCGINNMVYGSVQISAILGYASEMTAFLFCLYRLKPVDTSGILEEILRLVSCLIPVLFTIKCNHGILAVKIPSPHHDLCSISFLQIWVIVY